MHILDKPVERASAVISLALQRAAREGDNRWRDLLQALPVAVYTTDERGRITYYNDAAVALAGHRPKLGTAQWSVIWKLYQPDGTPLPHSQCPMALTLKLGEPVQGIEVVAERPDGTRIPFQPCPALLRDEFGKVIGGVDMLIDLSERKRLEEQQKVLIDELNHRVKNTLAAVQSIAVQTARSVEDLDAFAQSFEARLLALAKAHDLLTRGLWEGVNLHDLLDQLLTPFVVGAPERVSLDGPILTLPPRASVALAMALHELAANAARFGALSEPEGRLMVSWRIEREKAVRTMVLEWTEADGPPVSVPEKTGFGAHLIQRAIARDMQGCAELVFAPNGVRCRITAPLTD